MRPGGFLAFLYLLVSEWSQNLEAAHNAPKFQPEQKHSEPHRNPQNGKIVIENCKLYYEDVEKYGAYKATKWVEQGKYNLSSEELKREEARIKAKYDYLSKL